MVRTLVPLLALVLVPGYFRVCSRTASTRERSGYLVVDRGSRRLFELDPDLGFRADLSVRAPRALRRGRSGWWVLEGDSRGDRLKLFGPPPERRLLATHVFERVIDLTGDVEAPGALLEARAEGGGVLWQLSGSDPPRARVRVPDPLALAVTARRVLVAEGDGTLHLFARQGGDEAIGWGRVSGRPLRAVAAPRGGFWVQTRAAGGDCLVRLERDLRASWSRCGAGVGSAAQLGAAHAEGVWMVDGRGRLAHLGENGALDGPFELPHRGATALAGDGLGGVVVAFPGALWHVDASGVARASQGGFAWITDVVGPQTNASSLNGLPGSPVQR